MRYALLLIAAMLFFTAPSFSASVSGGIYSNTTWTQANSPYLVTGDIVVFDDYTLTIEPGVQVLFTGDYKIEVRGKFRAIGTDAANIDLKPENPTTDKAFWNGIVFIGNTFAFQNQCIMEYCNISNAYYAVDMNIAYHGPYIFRHCNFTNNFNVNNDGGMGRVYFDQCKFITNKTGISNFQFGGTITNCFFDGNESFGSTAGDTMINCTFVNHPNIAVSPAGYTSNCELHDNNIAVNVSFNSNHKAFLNNKIWNNTVGMSIEGCWNQTNAVGNEICGNTQYNIKLNTANNCSIPNNCWCSTDEVFIRSKIYDGYTDISKGLITFTPIAGSCNLAGINTNIDNEIAPASGNNVSVQVFPNPIPGNSFKMHSTEQVSVNDIALYDLMGKRINMTVKAAGSNDFEISANNEISGLYFLHVNTSTSKHMVQKVIFE